MLLGTGALCALLPACAEAQGAEGAPGAFLPFPGLLLAAALAAAALGLGFLRLRRRMEHDRAEAVRLTALAAAAPGTWYAWDSAGTLSAGPGTLPAGLATGPVESFDDIAVMLEAADATALKAAFDRLRRSGTGFDMVVAAAAGGRWLKIAGRRGSPVDGAGPLDVLWIEDATAAEERRRYSEAAADEARRLAAEAEDRIAELRGMLDALPLPVWLRRTDLSLAWINRAYVDAVDGSFDEILAEQREIAAGAIPEGGRALAQRALRLGIAQSESRHVVAGGERRLMEIVETPLGSADRAGFVLGYALDVTQMEEAHAELERHVAAHAEVLEQLKSAIAIFGKDRRLSFFNQAYVSLWDFDEAWLDTGPTIQEILEDLRERRRLPEHADFLSYKRSQSELFTSLIESQEELMHLPDGTTLRSVITPHPFGGLLFVQEDVTSALTLERNYNTLMAVQRESLDNLAEGIAVYGGDGRLRLSNPAFLRLWDLSEDDVEGHPHVSEVIDRTRRFYPDCVDWPELRKDLIGRALDRMERKVRLERTDGSVLQVATVPLPDGAVLNSYLDITDSVRVEQALRASNAALETADRLKSDFIANVSYQLRTPLNAIMGFAEILNNGYFGTLNPRQADYTRSIVDASQRLLSLINDILDLATIEAGHMALDRRPVDVKTMLKNVYDLTREWAGKQNLKVKIDCEDGIGRIDADERRLKQALYNLVSNAIKFTPAGGRITLSARREGGRLYLAVSDTGIGIPEADQERVFGRFEKAHPLSRQSGVGLGLPLVKSFIEMHGGSVALSSRPDEGTTVVCILPAEPGPPAGQPARTARKHPSAFN